MKGIPRRKGATDKIESRSARNVCFSKRRQGLFRKAEELRRLIPGVSVTAIAFSPAGKPFLSADPPPPTTKNEIDALLGLNITTLNAAHLHSHRNDLLRLKSFLLSMHHRSAADHDPRRHRNQVSTSATQIPEQEEHGSQRPSQMSTRCDDVPSHSGSTMVDGVGIQEADDQEFDAILRDLLDDDDTNCDMDYEEFDLLLRDLLDDGNANCDMDYGPCRNGVPEFTPVQSDGIEEDDEFGMMLRNFLNDDNANMDFDASEDESPPYEIEPELYVEYALYIDGAPFGLSMRRSIPATISLFNTEKQLKTGKNMLRLWYGKEADGSIHTTTPGKVPEEERGELERLEKLMNKYEKGQVQRIDWLNHLAFKSIDRIRERESGQNCNCLYLVIEFSPFEHQVVFQLPGQNSLKTYSITANNELVTVCDPEVEKTNPSEHMQRKLARSSTRGIIDRDLKPKYKRKEVNTENFEVPPLQGF